MKISAKGRYALLAVLQLTESHRRGKETTQVRLIAESQNIPSRYLVQILLQLNRAGVVSSTRGAKGGYALANPPEEITIGQVLRAVEGSLDPMGDVGDDTQEEWPAPFKEVWVSVAKAVSDIVDHVSFADLLDKLGNSKMLYYI